MEPTPIRPKRRYTRAEKTLAVGVAFAESQTHASEKLGIPLTTLNQWYNAPEYVAMRTTARPEVAESMWAGVQIGVAAMVKAMDDPKVPLRDKTDATSMLAEKYLLLTGQATNRTEFLSGVDEGRRSELKAVLRRASEEIA